MIIAIDFDGTLDRDSHLWGEFIDLAKTIGHRVICVTARRETEENIETIERWMSANAIDLPVYYTSLAPKPQYMAFR
ncbi:MAG: hypothetical protein AAGH89_18695, partial [Verrucomicrobiota bacterium]